MSVNSTILYEYVEQHANNSICPKLKSSEFGDILNDGLNELVKTLIDAREIVINTSKQTVLSLRNLSDDLKDTNMTTIKALSLWNTSSLILSIILGFLYCLLGFGVFHNHGTTTTYRLYSKVLIPIFILLAILLLIVSSALALAALVGTDVCYHSPESGTLYLLEQNKKQFHQFVYIAIRYYIKGCKDRNNIDLLFIMSNLALDALIKLEDLLRPILKFNVFIFTDICGQDNTIEPTLMALALLSDFLAITNESIQNIFQLLAFPNFHPIYTSIAQDGLCYNGVSGVTWLVFLLLVAAFSSLIIGIILVIRKT